MAFPKYVSETLKDASNNKQHSLKCWYNHFGYSNINTHSWPETHLYSMHCCSFINVELKSVIYLILGSLENKTNVILWDKS